MTKDILRAIRFPSLFVVILVLVHFYSTYYDIELSNYGVYPRRIDSLLGVITSPFIHSDWKHLCNNSIPLILLGSSLFHFYNRLALRVWGLSILYSGLLLWLGGRPSFHIGASGLVYALAFFIFFSGLIRKHKPLMAISLIVVFIYGGLVWGFSQERHTFHGKDTYLERLMACFGHYTTNMKDLNEKNILGKSKKKSSTV